MKKKIIILSSFMILFLVSLIVYTKAENISVKNSKEGINWQVGNSSKLGYQFYGYVELSDGYVVFQLENCRVRCSNRVALKYDKNGKMIWEKQADGYDEITPTNDDGYILWDYVGKSIAKYDKDGNQLWKNNSNESIYDLISVDDGVIALSDKGLTKYNNNDGTAIWDTTKDNGENGVSGLSKVIETDDGYVAVGVKSEEVNDKTTKYITSIIRYGKDGKIIWNEQYDNIFYAISKMINTGDGYVIVGHKPCGGSYCASIAKADKNGKLNLQEEGEVSEYENVVETTDGYVAIGYNSDGMKVNGFIIKYDKSGNVKWQHEEKNRRFAQVLVNGDEYIVGGGYNGIGTIFMYDKDGNLTDYHHIATGNIIEFSTDNFNDYIVLTSRFLTSYSINKKQSDMDNSGIYGIYKVGDMVEYNSNSYYVIENSDSNQEYVTLLKAENLTPDEINKYKGDIQVTENGVPFYTSTECYWNNEDEHKENGCINNYKKSFAQKIIENWASDALNENDLAKVGGYKVRSIKVDELINNLGYYYGDNGTSLSTCLASTLDTPEWVKNTESYWTMGGLDDGSSVYSVSSSENQACNEESYNTYGIRPVINLKKIAIEGSKEPVCKNGYDYKKQTKYNEFNIGDEVEYNGENYYVIENSDNYTKYITLLKAEPLTIDELYKYGQNEDNDLFVNKYSINASDPEKVVYEYDDGTGGMAYYTSETCGARYEWNASGYGYSDVEDEGCINNYEKSDVKKVVDNWSNENLNSKDLIEIDGYKTRLITIDDLWNNLAYSSNIALSGVPIYQPTDETPKWIYDNNYSYWTMSNYDDNNKIIMTILRSTTSNGSVYYSYNAIRPVINLDKCAVDGGCYEEDVAIGCKDDKTVVNVPSTLKMVSKILLIISSILIIGGIGLITFNYIKARRERK